MTSLVSESTCAINASHSEALRNPRLGSPSNTVEALANEDVDISTLTERQLLESASRRLGEYEVDEHDLEGIPYTANIIRHLCVKVREGRLTQCTIPNLSCARAVSELKLDGRRRPTYLRDVFL